MSRFFQLLSFGLTSVLVKDEKVKGKREEMVPSFHLSPLTFAPRAGGEQ
jgi:hypothetical protein